MTKESIDEINKKINLAYISFNKGDFDVAESILEKITDIKNYNEKFFFLKGLISGVKKKHDDAINNFKKAIELNPNESVFYFNLSIAYNSIGNHSESINFSKKTISLKPKNFNAWLNYGNSLRALNRFHESIECYEKALQIQSNFENAKINMALSLIDIGKENKAINILNSILSKNINNIPALTTLALSYLLSNKYEEALTYSNKCINLDPNNLVAISNRGIIYNHLKKFDLAIKDFDTVLLINKYDEKTLVNKGLSLKRIYKYDWALECLEDALKINSQSVEALCNKAGIYNDLDSPKEAKKNYMEALRINPNLPEANYGLAYIHLSQLDFEKGWQYFKWRFYNKKTNIDYFKSEKKEWDGDSSIKKLFIWSEQGIGDQIMFGSILKDLESESFEVLIYINNKIKKIFERSFPKFIFINELKEADKINYDAHISLIDLAKIYRKSIHDFTNNSSAYLIDDKTKTKNYSQRINLKERVCGLSWHSNNSDIGVDKSISLELFKPIFDLKIFKFINLQYGDVSKDLHKIKNNFDNEILNFEDIDLFEDIDELLSIIKSCNLIITSSNSTAHLAGALGIPTYLLVPKSRGKIWYWTAINNKSYWYKSINIIEQEKPNSWFEPIKELSSILKIKYYANN